jgi:hypothetical protein
MRIIEPNSDLTNACLKKGVSALNAMKAALKINEADWMTTAAYCASGLCELMFGKNGVCALICKTRMFLFS